MPQAGVLALFLNTQAPVAEEEVAWLQGTLPLRARSYLTEKHPPLEYVTSARAIVLRDDSVLTIRDPHGVHITPGGRREPGEALMETVRREVLEETGWTLSTLLPLGFRHFHHLNPRPEGYRYPHPDFFDVLYAALAEEFLPEAREVDGWELGASFQPVGEVAATDLTPGERFFLRAAWERLYRKPFPG